MDTREIPKAAEPVASGAPSLDGGIYVPADVPVLEASALFGQHRQVVIGHNGSRYVLRITKHGKLILNK